MTRRQDRFEELIERAARMRHDPPPAERVALDHFARAFGRETFRHQRIVGHYIVDFYFPHEKVIVEIDGDTHDDPDARVYDAERDGFLRGRGCHVIRVPNADVFQRPEWVVEQVAARLRRRATFFGRCGAGGRSWGTGGRGRGPAGGRS